MRRHPAVSEFLGWLERHVQEAAYIIERVLNLVITFVSGVVILRALGPVSFATYGMTMSVAQVSSAFARMSLDERFAAAYLSRRAPARLATALIAQRAVCGVALGLAVTLLFGRGLSVTGVLPTLAIGLVCLLESFSVAEIQVQALSRFRLLSGFGVARSAAGLALRLGLLWSGHATLGALLGVAVVELVIFRIGVYVASASMRSTRLAETAASLRDEPTVGSFVRQVRLRGYLITTVLAIAYSRTELLFAAAGLEAVALGTYLGAQRFVEVYAYLANVLGSLLLGPIAALRREDTRSFLIRTTLRIGGVATAFVVVNVLFLPAALRVVVGTKYPALPLTFAVLSLNVMPIFVGTPTGKVLLSQGRTRLVVLGSITAVVLCATLFFVLPGTLGSLRPALAVVIGNTIGCAVILVGAFVTIGDPASGTQLALDSSRGVP